MEYVRLGRSGMKVSRVCLGMMSFGDPERGQEWVLDEERARPLVGRAVEAGVTFFDMADMYSSGSSEECTGRLLREMFSRRDEYVLATKVFFPVGRGVNDAGLSRKHIMSAIDASLSRLGTDHVDLFLVQTPDPRTPIEETTDALRHAVTSGRARYVGVSNFPAWRTAQVHALLGADVGLAAVEVEYSLVQRGVEREVLPAALALGSGVLAWSPLGRGVLTGKYRRSVPADSRAASAHLAGFVAPYLGVEQAPVVHALVTAAEGLGVEPLEVALAWLCSRPGVSAAVLGARTPEQLRSALGSTSLELPDEIAAALDEVGAPRLGYPEVLS